MAAILQLATNNGQQICVQTPLAIQPVCRLLCRPLVGMGLLGCIALLGACRQDEPLPPVPAPTPQANVEQQPHLTRRISELQQAAQQRGWREGHNATVNCLHGERAQTDGNELRCEDQAYVEQNYPETNKR